MKRVIFAGVLGSMAMACSADSSSEHGGLSQAQFAQSAGADSEEIEEGQFQSAADAEEEDLELIAKANGWTLEEARAQGAISRVLGGIAETLAETRSDVFIAAALSKTPGGVPTIFVKGTADAALTRVLASSRIAIEVSDGHPFSLRELDAKTLEASQALKAGGFTNFATRVDLKDPGRVQLTVTRQLGLTDAAEDVRTLLPATLRESVNVAFQTEEVASDETSFGGMLTNGCTAGWSVASDAGPFGVLTAGHCSTQTTITHPPSTTHNLTFQFQHVGTFGDVEWYTTNVDEPAQFYSNNTTIRATNAVEPSANILVNESVCIYSRMQGGRFCSQVEDVTSVSCTTAAGTASNLVLMTGDVTVGGDSGAGWSFNNTAFGAHKGDCLGGNVFSRAALFFDALTVIVRTQ